jgi:hypothetical protein
MAGFVGDSGGSGEDVAAGRDVLDGKGKTATGPSTRLRSLRMTISIFVWLWSQKVEAATGAASASMLG